MRSVPQGCGDRAWWRGGWTCVWGKSKERKKELIYCDPFVSWRDAHNHPQKNRRAPRHSDIIFSEPCPCPTDAVF